jgi:hypothetical protein
MRWHLQGDLAAGDDEVDGMDHSCCLGDKRIFRPDISGKKAIEFLKTARACEPDCVRTPDFPGRSRLYRLPKVLSFSRTEIEPRMARMGTDYERVMETIFKPVRCILKSVKIRAI